MSDKVILNDDDSYGVEVASPDFNDQIKVTFALDISVGQQKEFDGFRKRISEEQDDTKKIKIYGELGEFMLKALVKDWNLYDKEEQKLPIDGKTIDSYMSKRLQGWITKRVQDFFIPTAPK